MENKKFVNISKANKSRSMAVSFADDNRFRGLICSLAVIIAVLFVSYWYDGGDEDAATENTGKYEPVLSGAVQSKKLAAVPGSFDLS